MKSGGKISQQQKKISDTVLHVCVAESGRMLCLLFEKINSPSESVGPSLHSKIAPDNLPVSRVKMRSLNVFTLVYVRGRAVSAVHTERLRKVEMNSG